ncbi:cysteine-rich and transmembrane domain-containing protein 1 isoform X1 [Heterocephalus glaber]|uniref:Cysteine-rich and transmembrane domain-containing protein 1 n=2 Tax=Heterocephalus glaber TaxID=10181 RepID=A0AAX6P288_HETGA|nr:cysteine-rich and transmembrane domain-containing protein 1 isoform X1 [Heterocephalus glaber]
MLSILQWQVCPATQRNGSRESNQITLVPKAVLTDWIGHRSMMNPQNPPPYPGPGPGPTAPYPPYPQPASGPMGGPYPPPQGYPYQGYPQYGWQGGPQEPPKTTVYVVEDQRRDDLGPSTCLTACWTALCCCCLWDMLT